MAVGGPGAPKDVTEPATARSNVQNGAKSRGLRTETFSPVTIAVSGWFRTGPGGAFHSQAELVGGWEAVRPEDPL